MIAAEYLTPILALVGCGLIVAGIMLGVKGRGGEAAGVQAFKVNVSGSSWLIIVAMGVAMLIGVWYLDSVHVNSVVKEPPTQESVVTIAQAEFASEEPDEPYMFGDDAALDALYVRCEDGEMQACDDLYQESPVGSEYEWFGATCGELFVDEPPEFCVEAPLDSVVETIEP